MKVSTEAKSPFSYTGVFEAGDLNSALVISRKQCKWYGVFEAGDLNSALVISRKQCKWYLNSFAIRSSSLIRE